jgi:RNA polymerase sigma-70 factor (ECF subfamily)
MLSACAPAEDEIARIYPRLYRTALRMTGSVHDADDATQQAVVQALDAWDRFSGAGLRAAWMHRILVNCVRDLGRRRALRAGTQTEDWVLGALASETPSAGDRLAREESRVALRRAIESLPDALRETFVMTVVDGYSYQEASDILNAPVGTISSRVHEARTRLRAALGPALQED